MLLVALSMIAAKPYEDTRHRFRVELPESWSLSPQFGDTHGMVFQRELGSRQRKSLATLIVHVDSVPANDSREYAEAHERSLEQQGALEKKGESTTTVGGNAALVREYTAVASKEPKLEKTMRAYFFEAAGHRYLLHLEAPSRDFSKLESDLEKIMKSFKALQGGVKTSAPIQIDAIDPAPNLTGTWTNDDGLVMVLGGDGSFALAEATGRFEVQGNVLTMIIPNQGRESFTFAHDAVNQVLTLSSPNLETPMVYRKGAATAQGSKKEGSKALVGRWITPTPNGALVLELRADGTFSMGTKSGQWSHASQKLTLMKTGAAAVTYACKQTGDRLALSGGDLEVEVVFTR
jgi:hypothetical protein